jgi:hypothetical protein
MQGLHPLLLTLPLAVSGTCELLHIHDGAVNQSVTGTQKKSPRNF